MRRRSRRRFLVRAAALALAGGLAACTTTTPSTTAGPTAAGPTTPGPTVATATPGPTTATATPVPTLATTTTPTPSPLFASSIGPITPALAARMTPTSWRAGCPVDLADLRYVTVSHRTFDGTVATGELVVHVEVADGVVEVFRTLFAAGYPIRSIRLVDDFGGSDDASMAADNTSAFSCRAITRGTGWSEHAYGRAIDLDPVENPYVRGSLVLPVEGAPFASRPDLPGVVHADDVVVRAFAAAGWQWGGSWTSPTDYQHFSTTGR